MPRTLRLLAFDPPQGHDVEGPGPAHLPPYDGGRVATIAAPHGVRHLLVET